METEDKVMQEKLKGIFPVADLDKVAYLRTAKKVMSLAIQEVCVDKGRLTNAMVHLEEAFMWAVTGIINQEEEIKIKDINEE